MEILVFLRYVIPYVMGLGLVHSVIGFEEVKKQSGEEI